MTTKNNRKQRATKPKAQTPIERAAKRAGIAADPYERAMRHVTSRFGEALVKACDQLGEEIATIAESAGGAGHGGEDNNVVDALVTLWKMRWELGIMPDQVSVDASASEYAIERALHRSAKSEGNGADAEGGAS